MLKLRISNNPKNTLWLVEPRLLIGSASDCDLQLSHPGIEQRHAEIAVDHETLTFTLLADHATATVNGHQVKPGAAVVLKVDDRLGLGGVELQVIDPKQERVQAPIAASQAAAASGWALKANHSALANRVYPLADGVVVGRSQDCDIVFAAAHLSRRHAQLFIRDGALYVKDLQSSNGTFRNGQRVTEARVKRGDELRFDTLSFGVIGPADELDKTSIRVLPDSLRSLSERVPDKPALNVRPTPASTLSPGGHGGETLDAAARGATASGTARPAQMRKPVAVTRIEADSIESHKLEQPSAGRRLAVGLGLLLIIGGGLYVAWRHFGLPA